MTIAPFAPGAVDSRRTADMFVQLRRQGVDLERQLTTGRRADSFAQLGVKRGAALDLRARLSTLASFQTNVKDADLRLKLMLQNTQGLAQIASQTRAGALAPSSGVVGGGRPLEQIKAQGDLALAIDLLNVEAGGRHLFSGRTHDQKPVANYQTIVDGVGAAITQARIDQGANATDTGFLEVGPAAGANVTLSKTGAQGFQLESATSSSGAITIAPFGPGDPSATITVASVPAAGASFSVTLSLPDGSQETITLTATDSATPGAGEFTIGADEATTAANISTALGAAVGAKATGALAAASAVQASDDFFANPANWYYGDTQDPAFARSTAAVRIDEGRSVSVGAQANEQGFTRLLSQLAVLAADDFSDGDRARYEGTLSRVAGNLTPAASDQKISDVGIELGAAQSAMAGAVERHRASEAILRDQLGGIEEAPVEEVAAKLLALQNRLQASYQTTSLLSRLSLVNFL
ncbi:MAG: hypothetical protein EA385_17060 [Salinarimonadaceae bacterium]|nr:MAG: hypothetical protein EA385_17060 [Salinarimonadaceae bacterium]